MYSFDGVLTEKNKGDRPGEKCATFSFLYWLELFSKILSYLNVKTECQKRTRAAMSKLKLNM